MWESPQLLHDLCVKTSAREMMETFQPSTRACGQTGGWFVSDQLHLQMCNRGVISVYFITWAAQRRCVVAELQDFWVNSIVSVNHFRFGGYLMVQQCRVKLRPPFLCWKMLGEICWLCALMSCSGYINPHKFSCSKYSWKVSNFGLLEFSKILFHGI